MVNHLIAPHSTLKGILSIIPAAPVALGPKIALKSVAIKPNASVKIHPKNNTHKTINIESNIAKRIFVAKNVNLDNFVNEIDFMNDVLFTSSIEPPKYNNTDATIPIVIDDGIIHAAGNKKPSPISKTIGIINNEKEVGDLNKVFTSCMNSPFIRYPFLYKYLSFFLYFVQVFNL